LDHSPLKLLDTGKHATEDKRFFLSEHLLNVGQDTPLEHFGQQIEACG